MTLQDAQVVHFLPGRIRLKSAQVKGSDAMASEVQRTFTALPGVFAVAASPTTGSIVVLYDPESQQPLQSLAASLGWPEMAMDRLEHWLRTTAQRAEALLPGGITQLFGGSSAAAADASSGWATLPTLVPLSLLLLGVRSLVVTSPLPFPQWHDYFWFAFGTYMALNPLSRTQTPKGGET